MKEINDFMFQTFFQFVRTVNWEYRNRFGGAVYKVKSDVYSGKKDIIHALRF